ncbi:MAG: hypothetical protein KKB70_05960, partial [Proteobacteria bacterium]|nr:hypothetical protein [Pseudomonadota bacterium]
ALSSQDSTLNLLHTYEDRAKKATLKMASNGVAIAAMFFAALVAAAFVWGGKLVEVHTTELAALEDQLSKTEEVDEAKLQIMAGKVGLRQTSIREVGSRYETLALLTEISDLIPAGVRIISMDIDFGEDPKVLALAAKEESAKQKGNQGKGSELPTRKVILDGIVMGEEQSYETLLTRMLANLDSSVLIMDVTVQKNEVEVLVPVGSVLHFIVEASLS